MARKIKIDNAVLKRLERQQQKEIKCKKILCRILIVCEGEKTEPLYFKKFKTINNNSFTYEVKCEGCGEGTMKVVDTAIELELPIYAPVISIVMAYLFMLSSSRLFN